MSKFNHTGHSPQTEALQAACTGCGVSARPGCGYAVRSPAWPVGRYVYACDACARRIQTDDRFDEQFARCANARLCVAHVEQGFKQLGFNAVPTGDAELIAALENPGVLAATLMHAPPGGYHPHPSA